MAALNRILSGWLYAFENSVREFVDGHLTAEYGRD